MFPGDGANLIAATGRAGGCRENRRDCVAIPSLVRDEWRFDRAPMPHLRSPDPAPMVLTFQPKMSPVRAAIGTLNA
jgi:hypothetical protein